MCSPTHPLPAVFCLERGRAQPRSPCCWGDLGPPFPLPPIHPKSHKGDGSASSSPTHTVGSPTTASPPHTSPHTSGFPISGDKGLQQPFPHDAAAASRHPPTILPPSSSFSFPPNPSAWENSPPCPSLQAFIFFQGAALQRRICSQQKGQRAPCKELPGHGQGLNCNLEILYKHTLKNSPLLVSPGFAAAARHARTHPAPGVRWPDLARRRCAPGIPLQPCPAHSRAPPASPCPWSGDPPVFQQAPLKLGGSGCGLGARRRVGSHVPGVAAPCGVVALEARWPLEGTGAWLPLCGWM